MPTANCTRNCWIAAAGLGLLVWIFTAGSGPLRWFEGLFLGLIAAGLMGAFLIWAVCRGAQAMDSSEWHPKVHATSFDEDMQLHPRGVASEMGRGFLGGAEGSHTHPVAPSGDAQPPSSAERSTSERNDIYAPARPKPAATENPAKAATDTRASGTGNGAEQRPEADEPDDLKLIKGVGPKLEEVLHEHGVTRFAQIAAWDEARIDHFAEVIGRMGGRIRSDDWVGQARILTQGGETEFSKRVEEGDVY